MCSPHYEICSPEYFLVLQETMPRPRTLFCTERSSEQIDHGALVREHGMCHLVFYLFVAVIVWKSRHIVQLGNCGSLSNFQSYSWVCELILHAL